MRCARFSLSRSPRRKSRGKSQQRSRSPRGEKKSGHGIGNAGRSSTGNSKQAYGRSKSRDRARMRQDKGEPMENGDDRDRDGGHRFGPRHRGDTARDGGARPPSRHRSNSRRGLMGESRRRSMGRGGPGDRRGPRDEDRGDRRGGDDRVGGRHDMRGGRRRSRDGGRRSRSRGRRSMSRRRNGPERSPRRRGTKEEEDNDNPFHKFGPPSEPPKEEEPLIVPVDENLSDRVKLYNNLRIRPAGPFLPQLIVDACLRLIAPLGGHCFIGRVAKELRIPADAFTTHFCVQGPFIVLRPDEMEKAASLPPLPVQPAPGSHPEVTQKQGRFQSPVRNRERSRRR